MASSIKPRRALLSVSDKSGLLDLAAALRRAGVELLSTGGTAKALKDAGIEVTLVEAHTGFPEMMDGRLKTLHPKVHGGLLAIRGKPEHDDAALKHNIPPIDLAVVNLYPFRETVAKSGVSMDEAIENIDIGGPTMVRSAAKNHRFVAVLTSPAQYATFLAELTELGGTTLALRQRLAAEAFAHTAAYDSLIASYLAPRFIAPLDPAAAMFPQELSITYQRAQLARYGENPHQRAAIYRTPLREGPSVVHAAQLHGKELSYNNVNDAAAAMDLAIGLAAGATTIGGSGGNSGGGPHISAAVIKHANPCGAATGPMSTGVLACISAAIAGDPLAAFGGILACTGTIDAAAAERLVQKDIFLEVLIAAGYEPAALEMLKARSANIRLLAVPELSDIGKPGPISAGGLGHGLGDHEPLSYRSIPGGLLVQERDVRAADPASWVHAAGPAPTASQLISAIAIERMVQAMSSNAIAIGGVGPDGLTRLFGGGVGQVDRVTACRLAVEKCRATQATLARGAIAVSDAFFPFADGPTILADAGVAMIVHPGGSKRDADTFALCNDRAICCMTTQVRRFRH